MSYRARLNIEQRIARLIAHAKALDDDETKAEVAKYVCILASGYVEAACREFMDAYTATRAAPEILRYVKGKMERFNNPNKERILGLLNSLDPVLAGRAAVEMDDELDAIGSIMGHRHQLVHGRNSGISLVQVMDYYQRARTLFSKLRKLVSS